MFRLVAVIVGSLLLAPQSAHAAVTATGKDGASISVPQVKFSKETRVKVSGRGFDETIGIYLAYCVIPKKGAIPSPCGGGVNMQGVGEASYWISSNPPPYGVGLAIPFKAGGRFTESVSITRTIGKFDCRKVKCAITVRSDHLHEGDRSHDIFLPIRFIK